MKATDFTIVKTGLLKWTAYVVAPDGFRWKGGPPSVTRMGRRRTEEAIRKRIDRVNAINQAEGVFR